MPSVLRKDRSHFRNVRTSVTLKTFETREPFELRKLSNFEAYELSYFQSFNLSASRTLFACPRYCVMVVTLETLQTLQTLQTSQTLQTLQTLRTSHTLQPFTNFHTGGIRTETEKARFHTQPRFFFRPMLW